MLDGLGGCMGVLRLALDAGVRIVLSAVQRTPLRHVTCDLRMTTAVQTLP